MSGGTNRSLREEYFASLSEDFNLVLCGLDGAVLASFNGVGVAGSMVVLPPLPVPERAAPSPPPSEDRGSGHRLVGWVTVLSSASSASGEDSLRRDDEDGAAAGIEDSDYPVGARFLVMRSEVYLELYELQRRPGWGLGGWPGEGSAGTSGTRAAPPFVFVAVAHMECPSPIVTLSPSYVLDCADGAYTLLIRFFGGDIMSLTVQVGSRGELEEESLD